MRFYSSTRVTTAGEDGWRFGVKFSATVLLLLWIAHTGTDALASRWYASTHSTNDTTTQQVSAIGSVFTEKSDAETDRGTPVLFSKEIPYTEILATSDREVYVDQLKKVVTLVHAGEVVEYLPIRYIPTQTQQPPIEKGLYTVRGHTTSLYSTIADVHIPYYVRVSPQLKFHGMPYRPQGDPQPYSGDGVLLASGDAQRLFQFVREGTPVIVVNTLQTHEHTSPVITATNAPRISAHGFAVADLLTGDLVLEKNSEKPRAIASITKLVTAAVAMEQLGEERVVPTRSQRGTYSVRDLLYPLLLRSDNSVADSLAQTGGSEWFLSHMNALAQTIGMSRTRFFDASGLSAYNVSTPQELTRLARYLYTHHPDILAISAEKNAVIRGAGGGVWRMNNQNRFAGDPHFVGGKLGFTDEAGRTGVSIVTIPTNRGVHPFAIVVLGSENWKHDSDLLINWLKQVTHARATP